MVGVRLSQFKTFPVFLAILLLLPFLFMGCTDNLSPPFSVCQLINKVYETDGLTKATCASWLAGDYNNLLIGIGGVDNNSLQFYDINSVSADVNWASLDFPAGCPVGQAVQVIGTTLTCIDLTVDTNVYTARIVSRDDNGVMIDWNPDTTLTQSLGTGALRWLNLFVQNINSEEIDTFNVVASGDVNAGYFNGDGSNLTGIVDDSNGIFSNQLLRGWLGYDNVRIGTHATTPRIMFENGDANMWEIDHGGGGLRFYDNNFGKVTLRLFSTGSQWGKINYRMTDVHYGGITTINPDGAGANILVDGNVDANCFIMSDGNYFCGFSDIPSTISSSDTNWVTSWDVFDANMAATYYPLNTNPAGYITSFSDTNFETAGLTLSGSNTGDQTFNDTNAETACSALEYLAGDGTCQTIVYTIDTNLGTYGVFDSDTNSLFNLGDVNANYFSDGTATLKNGILKVAELHTPLIYDFISATPFIDLTQRYLFQSDGTTLAINLVSDILYSTSDYAQMNWATDGLLNFYDNNLNTTGRINTDTLKIDNNGIYNQAGTFYSLEDMNRDNTGGTDTNAQTACGAGQVLGGNGDGCIDTNTFGGVSTDDWNTIMGRGNFSNFDSEIIKSNAKSLISNNDKNSFVWVSDSDDWVQRIAEVGQPSSSGYAINIDPENYPNHEYVAPPFASGVRSEGTVSITFKWDDTRYWGLYRDYSGTGYLFVACQSSKIMARYWDPVTGAHSVWTAFSDTTSTHHLVVTYGTNDMRMYLDGASVGTPITSMSPTKSTTTHYGVGVYNMSGDATQGWDGQIDEFATWTRVFSDADAKYLYNTGGKGTYLTTDMTLPSLTAITTNMTVLYHFDTGSGSTAIDSSGQGNNGTLTNIEAVDWVTGIVSVPPANAEASVWKAEDGTASGEKGIITFGDETGRTVIKAGTGIFFNDSTYLQSDSDKFYWGAGKDASITYNGTNLILNPQEVGSGKLKIDGNIILTSPDSTEWNCGVTNAGAFTCS